MKFSPVVPEICRGQIHGAWKERIIIIIRRRNGAKTISLQTSFGDLIRIRIVKKKRRITILHPTTVRVM